VFVHGAVIESPAITVESGAAAEVRAAVEVQPAGLVRRAAALLRGAVAAVESLEPSDAVRLAPLFADAARVAQAGTLRCAHVAGDRGARQFAGEKNAASLLSAVSKTSLGKARSGLDIAQKLQSAPVAEDALWQGDLSLDQAAVIAPVAALAPEAAGDLLEAAKGSSVKELKEVAARTLRNRRGEQVIVGSERRLHERRFCRTWVDDAGGVRLEALFGPRDGASVVAALDDDVERLRREVHRVGREESPERLRADALVALVAGDDRLRSARPGSHGARVEGPVDRRAGCGAESGGSGADGADAGTGDIARRPVANVLVRVDAAALKRGAACSDEMCEIAGIGPVSVRIARELLCEGFLTLLVTDGVDVRTVTSTTRTVPSRVEKALQMRDPHCVVPGCGASQRLQIDHWHRDFSWRGPTELANLCRICATHHAMKTRTGWRLAGGPGKWRWLPPKTVAELREERARRSASKGRQPSPLAVRGLRSGP
jgi:hypothetical protein